MKKNRYKKPNKIIYSFGRLCGKLYSKFKLNLKVEVNETKKAKKPYIVIANHEASIDFMSLLAALKGRKIYVVSNAYYQTNPIKWLLDKCRVIPKQQFNTTVSDMKKMKAAIDNNLPLVFYPAGLMTGNGISTPIPEATGKSLKWFGCDVYAAVTKGSYLSHPKWSNINRKGKVTLNITKLFSKEDLKTLNEKEINQKVKEILDYDSYDNQKKAMIPYKHGDNIEGIENILYKCPKCGKEFVIKSIAHNKLTCTNCNYEVTANKYGLFDKTCNNEIIFDSPSDWSRYIKDDLKNNFPTSLESQCEIEMINYQERKFETVGNGTVKINEGKILLSGLIKNKEINKEFFISKIPTLPYSPGKCFDLQEEKETYRIILSNPKHTTKWVYYAEISHEKLKK